MSDQWIDDSDLRKYRIELPNIIDDLHLSPRAFRLYVHAKRVCGASPAGECWQSTKTIADICNMSLGSVSAAKKELVAAGVITITRGDRSASGQARSDRIRIVDLWPVNFEHFSPAGQADGRSIIERTRSYIERTLSTIERTLSTIEPKKEPSEEGTNEEAGPAAAESVGDRRRRAGGPPSSAPSGWNFDGDYGTRSPVANGTEPAGKVSRRRGRVTSRMYDPGKVGVDGYIPAGDGSTPFEVLREVAKIDFTKPKGKWLAEEITDLDKWRETVNDWIVRNGYRPNNLAGMVEVYHQGWDKKNGRIRTNGSDTNGINRTSAETNERLTRQWTDLNKIEIPDGILDEQLDF